VRFYGRQERRTETVQGRECLIVRPGLCLDVGVVAFEHWVSIRGKKLAGERQGRPERWSRCHAPAGQIGGENVFSSALLMGVRSAELRRFKEVS
jgi:hypothetical protein